MLVPEGIPPALDLLGVGVRWWDQEFVGYFYLCRVDAVGAQIAEPALQDRRIAVANVVELDQHCPRFGNGVVAQRIGLILIIVGEGLTDLAVDILKVLLERRDIPAGGPLRFSQGDRDVL